MTLTKKIIFATLFFLLVSGTITAQRRPEPPKPQQKHHQVKQNPNRRHPRLETIEGKIIVHHREIYIETKKETYKLIIDNRNPRLNYNFQDFVKLNGKYVELDGYKNNFFNEFEVVRLVKILKNPEPPRPQKQTKPVPPPKPQPRPRPQR